MVTVMRPVRNSAPARQVLIAGNIVMLALLPVVQQAAVVFSGHVRSVVAGIAAAQAIVSLLMLLRRIQVREQRGQQKLAARLADALRGGIL